MNFKDLWKNHPSNNDDLNPCLDDDNYPNFENQCAIRMGVALKRSNFSMSGYTGQRCWHHPKNCCHTLRVEELLKYLLRKLPSDTMIVRDRKGGELINADDFEGKTGIIIFQNFWGSWNQGDHIDVWNGEEMTHGDIDYFERSEKVLFWEID